MTKGPFSSDPLVRSLKRRTGNGNGYRTTFLKPIQHTGKRELLIAYRTDARLRHKSRTSNPPRNSEVSLSWGFLGG